MTAPWIASARYSRSRVALALIPLIVVFAACADVASTETGLRTDRVSVPSDTIQGSGQLSELQEKRAAWLARGINDYRFEYRLSCFCAGNNRPVLIEVRGGTIAKVWDLETVNPLRDIAQYKTITELFDAAIAERQADGNVSIAYDQSIGFPVRLEIGTVANDAGVLHFLGGFVRL